MSGSRLEVYRTRSLVRGERWRWRLLSENGNTIAQSSEGYANRQHAVRMATQVAPEIPLTIIPRED